jgi:hypothetical protein
VKQARATLVTMKTHSGTIGLDFLLGHRCDGLGSLHYWETFDADCQTARLDVSSTFDTGR